MTKQERDERKEERKSNYVTLKAKFPGVQFRVQGGEGFYDYCGEIVLRAGDPAFITLRRRTNSKWFDEAFGYESVSVGLRQNLPSLAQLIRGLVLRYNAIAEEINTEALAVPSLEPLAVIPPELTKPRSPVQ